MYGNLKNLILRLVPDAEDASIAVLVILARTKY